MATQPELVSDSFTITSRGQKQQEKAAAIPHAQGHLFKGAGHAFLFRDARQVGQTADKFLDAPTPTGGLGAGDQ